MADTPGLKCPICEATHGFRIRDDLGVICVHCGTTIARAEIVDGMPTIKLPGEIHDVEIRVNFDLTEDQKKQGYPRLFLFFIPETPPKKNFTFLIFFS